MKKTILLPFIYFFLIVANSQTISLFPNPDTAYGYNGSLTRYKNKLIGSYVNNSGIIQLAIFDGSATTLVNNPDAGYIPKTYNKFVLFRNNAYFLYKNAASEIQLARYNDTSITLIPNPGADLRIKNTGIDEGFFYSYIFNNQLYLVFKNSLTNKNVLARFNDTSFTVFNNPDAGPGVDEAFFTYNNALYISYKNINAKTQLCKIAGNTINPITNAVSNANWTNITSFSNIEKGGFYYLVVDESKLAQFNGSTVNVIANPAWASGMLSYTPVVYKSDIYTIFHSQPTNLLSNIARYSNGVYTKINNPDSYGAHYTNIDVYGNKLYFDYKHNYYSQTTFGLGSFDSVTYQVYNNPDTTFGIYPNSVLNNYIVCDASKLDGWSFTIKLALLYNSTLTIINNPDNGYGVSNGRDTLNNKYYFVYQDINTKCKIGFIDFGTLPVIIKSFTAKRNNKSVMLNWTTSNEVNTSDFKIKRSLDGKNFNTIATIKALNTGNYSFIDNEDLTNRTIYYSLETVDKDGAIHYSNIQTVGAIDNIASIVIYPNPAKEQVVIRGNFKELKIIDGSGKTVITKQSNITKNEVIVNISQLKKGIYFVKCITSDKSITEKLIIE